MIGLLIQLIVLGLVFYLLYWASTQIPMPEPVRVVIKVVLAIFLILCLLNIIGFVGPPMYHGSWPTR